MYTWFIHWILKSYLGSEVRKLVIVGTSRLAILRDPEFEVVCPACLERGGHLGGQQIDKHAFEVD